MAACATTLFLAGCILTVRAFNIRERKADSSESSEDRSKAKYKVEEHGSLYSTDYAMYMKGPQGYVSPWHDIPLFADEAEKVYNMVVEIPRWTNAKMEMTTRAQLSPIKQDQKNGKVRFVSNVFPYHGYIWNYGALPQTWENNTHIDPDTGAKGDNDPIDIIEIGSRIHKRGAVIQVKLLGCLALIDSEETDWKLVAIDVTDPDAKRVNSMDDVERVFPGYANATVDWFKYYKVPAGNPPNKFAYNGTFRDSVFCHKVIEETNVFWKQLMAEPNPHLNTLSTTNSSLHYASPSEAAAIVAAAPPRASDAALPKDVEKYHYIPDKER